MRAGFFEDARFEADFRTEEELSREADFLTEDFLCVVDFFLLPDDDFVLLLDFEAIRFS